MSNNMGYDETFIGGGNNSVPLPGFSPSLAGVVLRSEKLREGTYLDYINYTLVMNKVTRQLIYSASNIDQSKHLQIDQQLSKGWELDSRIRAEDQLDNRFYKSNDWDRGHMVQRSNNCWGDSFNKALNANDATYFYTNAAFQHKYFNQDEWLKLETFIGSWADDSDGKLSIFTGPIHRPFDRQYACNWFDTVRIPSAFFKVVCFKEKTSNHFSTRAFLLYQEDEFIENKKQGAKKISLKNYQVTIAEIEALTGLVFSSLMASRNPLYYSDPGDLPTNVAINHFPERIPVERFNDIVTEIARPRPTQDVKASEKTIVIAAAMVNPKGRNEKSKEWVSLLNLSAEDALLDDWILENGGDVKIHLDGTLHAGESQCIRMKDHKGFRLVNTGATLVLKNTVNEVVDRVTYKADAVSIQNKALQF